MTTATKSTKPALAKNAKSLLRRKLRSSVKLGCRILALSEEDYYTGFDDGIGTHDWAKPYPRFVWGVLEIWAFDLHHRRSSKLKIDDGEFLAVSGLLHMACRDAVTLSDVENDTTATRLVREFAAECCEEIANEFKYSWKQIVNSSNDLFL